MNKKLRNVDTFAGTGDVLAELLTGKTITDAARPLGWNR